MKSCTSSSGGEKFRLATLMKEVSFQVVVMNVLEPMREIQLQQIIINLAEEFFDVSLIPVVAWPGVCWCGGRRCLVREAGRLYMNVNIIN